MARRPERRAGSFVGTALVLALAGCVTTPGPAPQAVAIVGVTIIDPTSSDPPLTEQTILVANGEIQLIGPTAAVTYPAGTRQIDGHGKFAIPGLWDAHVHFMNTGASALPLYIANGVTSVREMGGYIDSTRAWQARMRAGTLVGPRILTPGPMLESPSYLQRVVERSQRDPRLATRILPYRIGVRDSTEARLAIDSLRKLHVDFVKFRTTASPEAVYAILRYARRARLRVAGHQPVVPITNALDSGFADMQHAFLPPLSRLSEAARDSIYRKFVETNAWYTPTLAVSRTVLMRGDSAERAIFGPDAMRLDERRQYAAPILLDWWRMQVDERKSDTSARRLAVFNEGYRSSANDVRRMSEIGVKILAGTDAGSVLVYPGFALHDEL
ncbi:MAG TPA: amidohydrolase family protein, partial [Gemmatimonadaceae bacterium]|nr:amidohydrolase family protein [Gemmatimonadaceae bacterium]